MFWVYVKGKRVQQFILLSRVSHHVSFLHPRANKRSHFNGSRARKWKIACDREQTETLPDADKRISKEV